MILNLPSDALVVDVGGTGRPLARANKIIDLRPMRIDGDWRHSWGDERRHTAEDWILMDFCAESLPFGDKEVDFIWCCHTLENVRDPVFVCREMNRVAKSGYIETPSRAGESISQEPKGQFYGGRYCGHLDHRWFCELVDGILIFTMKTSIIWTVEEFRRYPYWNHDRVLSFYWEGEFEFKENMLHNIEEIYNDARRFLEANMDQWKRDVAREGHSPKERGLCGT